MELSGTQPPELQFVMYVFTMASTLAGFVHLFCTLKFPVFLSLYSLWHTIIFHLHFSTSNSCILPGLIYPVSLPFLVSSGLEFPRSLVIYLLRLVSKIVCVYVYFNVII